jgi:hypothetical protein
LQQKLLKNYNLIAKWRPVPLNLLAQANL